MYKNTSKLLQIKNSANELSLCTNQSLVALARQDKKQVLNPTHALYEFPTLSCRHRNAFGQTVHVHTTSEAQPRTVARKPSIGALYVCAGGGLDIQI